MNKPTILTGLRANNDLHIGNYFGALLPIADMAATRAGDYQVNLMIADLHSFITPIDHSQLHEQILQNIRLYVAAGLPLDQDNIRVFRQSYVPAHSELAWILNCFTGMGEMSRMTEFKDKAAKLGEERVNVGLFDYPALMAADVILYNTTYVPVGDDQTQHLEYIRNIAERMNTKFNQELFIVPLEVKKQHEFFGKDQGLRIKDLVDPSKKMSKSDESGRGIIFLGDTPEDAHKKIMGATTDDKANIAYDPENQPGISNLLQIYGLLKGKTAQEAAREFIGQTQYGEFKKIVAEAAAEFLRNFQAKLAQVDQAAINVKLESSEKAMNEIANATLLRVQKAVGLRS
jgi:tryptophanyl-tRNA synthetase